MNRSSKYVVFPLAALVVAVLWRFLPIAVFGTKPLISQAIKEAKDANALLKHLVVQQQYWSNNKRCC